MPCFSLLRGNMLFFQQLWEVISTSKYILLILQGFRTTLIIAVGASVLGLVLGIIVAVVKIAAQKNKKGMAIPLFICNLYVSVIRGTPVALQLFIMAFAIFAIRGFPLELTAVLTFGINSGAYVAESLRGGIQSVDAGQEEAARSLGLSGMQSMMSIIIPQAIKNVIPAIGNELIALLKETSIVSMVGIIDLTFAAKIIGAGNEMATYLAPMVVVALFYLAVVYLLIFGIRAIERKMKQSEQHIDERKAEKCRIRMEKRLKAIDENYEKICARKGF